MSDLRKRNNTASKKSYDKSIERQYADDYEHEMVRQHMDTHPNTDAYHWSVVPEEYLYEAGYITDFNKHRLERLMRKKEKKAGENRVRDYGFDGLAKTRVGDNVVFSGLQAKYYLNNQVCAGDIGTFLAMQIALMLKNPLSKGFLYTTSRLQADLAGNVANPSYPIRHILHPWKHPDARSKIPLIPVQQECDKSLRADQIDALNQLEDKDGINALNTPCRWGKTIVAGHHTKRINATLVVAIAPLLVSVENLQSRLACFLPDHSPLIVDSDTGGTTNVEEIKKILASKGKHIIYSTFKSATDILSEIITDYDNAYILGDEIHNANPQLCEFVNQFPQGLVMSATLPTELYELLDINHTVYISFAQVITDGIIVDYTLWLPHLTKASDGTTSVDIEIPVEFSTYDSDLTAKAFYLATVMLKTGSRRCITYLGRQEECDRFNEVVAQIFEKYHGLTIWTGKIDSTISKAKRKEVLEEFQTVKDDVYHILTSVRILDEAVDIPRCDSVFITNVGEHSSDIRMMQRSQRSSTKDPKNPSKHNNIILWADGWEKCVGALDRLREADPEFHKKVRIADSNYDKSGDVAILEAIKKEVVEFTKWEHLQSLNYSDKQLLIVKKYIDFVKKNKRQPQLKDNLRDIYYGHKYWLDAVKCKGSHILYPKSKELLDETLPGWSNTYEENQHIAIYSIHTFLVETGRLPTSSGSSLSIEKQTEAQQNENALYEQLYKFRRSYKDPKSWRCKIYDSSIQLLNKLIPNWYKSKHDNYIKECDDIIEYHKTNGVFPTSSTPNLGYRYQRIRNAIILNNNTSYPYDIIANKLDTYKSTWRETIDIKQDNLVDEIIEFFNINKRLPIFYSKPSSDIEKYERQLAKKITSFRTYIQNSSICKDGKIGGLAISNDNIARIEKAISGWVKIGKLRTRCNEQKNGSAK